MKACISCMFSNEWKILSDDKKLCLFSNDIEQNLSTENTEQNSIAIECISELILCPM